MQFRLFPTANKHCPNPFNFAEAQIRGLPFTGSQSLRREVVENACDIACESISVIMHAMRDLTFDPVFLHAITWASVGRRSQTRDLVPLYLHGEVRNHQPAVSSSVPRQQEQTRAYKYKRRKVGVQEGCFCGVLIYRLRCSHRDRPLRLIFSSQRTSVLILPSTKCYEPTLRTRQMAARVSLNFEERTVDR